LSPLEDNLFLNSRGRWRQRQSTGILGLLKNSPLGFVLVSIIYKLQTKLPELKVRNTVPKKVCGGWVGLTEEDVGWGRDWRFNR
jgi:hypothetical protein